MKLSLFIVFLSISQLCFAQASMETTYKANLSKLVTINAQQQKISSILDKMSKSGKFYFAYNGALFKQDSLVNIEVRNMPVRTVLDQIFYGKVDYKENSDYIILRYAVNHLTIEPESIVTAENLYMISGHIVDVKTGLPIKNASVYEKQLLQSTLTDKDGFFNLKFKGDHRSIILTAAKETYRDTSLVFLSSINIKPTGYDDPDKEKGTFFSNAIEDLGIGKFFLSSKQRLQNLNIPNFLANAPFQASLTPGLSSHGMMSSRVVNKVSLNVLGGYTAGVDGTEVAGLFNLTKGDVKKVQIAGLFNVVGENLDGVQVAGLFNNIGGQARGIQISGFNHVKGTANGVQISAIGNRVSNAYKGVQVTGLFNLNNESTKGVQVAALGNITLKTLRGVQVAGVFNVAKNNKGIQIGLINMADTSSGVSLGLLNIIKNGYHQLSFSSNDLIHANVTLKTGNDKLYTIFLAGKNLSDTAKIETFGLGFGHDFLFNKTFSLGFAGTAQHLYLGNWDHGNILTKATANVQIKLLKWVNIFGGPVYNYYVSNAPANASAKNYKQQIVPDQHQLIGNYKGWLGWNFGLTLF